jgi:hypothetical protein
LARASDWRDDGLSFDFGVRWLPVSAGGDRCGGSLVPAVRRVVPRQVSFNVRAVAVVDCDGDALALNAASSDLRTAYAEDSSGGPLRVNAGDSPANR